MNEHDQRNFPDELRRSLEDCQVAIARQEYVLALRVINNALATYPPDVNLDGPELLSAIHGVVAVLQVTLTNVYGEEWARNAGIPFAPAGAEACSFCGKDRHQVDQLIAGCNGFICRACCALAHKVFAEGGCGDASN